MSEHRTPEEQTAVAMAQLDGMADLWFAKSGFAALTFPEPIVRMIKQAHLEGLYKGRCSVIDEPPKEIRDKLDAAADLEQSFDLRWNADMRAIKRWQAAAPEGEDRSLTWPDHADMVVWLLERLDLVTARLRAHALSRCPDRETGATKYTHCDECDTRWMGDETERHKPECVFSQPSN